MTKITGEFPARVTHGSVTGRVSSPEPTHKEIERKRLGEVGERPVHLYHLWHRGESGIRGVATGFGVCGSKAPRKELTHERERATCKNCLRKINTGE